MRLAEGDRVALLVAPTTAYVDAVLSLLARGIVPIPLDPRLTDHERERILTPLSPTLVVTDDAALAAVTTEDRGVPRSDGRRDFRLSLAGASVPTVSVSGSSADCSRFPLALSTTCCEPGLASLGTSTRS